MVKSINLLIRLRNIFRDIFNDEEMSITEETYRSDIEDWDSVSHVKIVLAVEEEFAIRLTTDEVASIKSVGGFIAAINRHTEI